MFLINTEVHKPNHALMLEHATRWTKRGFRFDSLVWKHLTDTAALKAAQLRELGLKNPDSPRELEWFLRSFNSLEITAQMYDLKKAKWDLTVESLCEVADKFSSVPELRVLYEYKEAQATARSFMSLSRKLVAGELAFPKVTRTSTNRVMFVEPYISGLPKTCKPFLPMSRDSTLVSVDVKSQEPNIIANWFGSEKLRLIAATEQDIYTGVAKAAFLPKVKAYAGTVRTHTEVGKCGVWLWEQGDMLLYLADVAFDGIGLPDRVTGIFASGMKHRLAVNWGEEIDGVITGEILPDVLNFRLSKEERKEVKKVWNIMAYGGAKTTAKSCCNLIDGDILSTYIRRDLRATKLEGDGLSTCFGTALHYKKSSMYKAQYSRIAQGTGADIMALLVERFYSEVRPEGLDIYFTIYDELVMEIPNSFIRQHGGVGVGEYLRDIFEHTINDTARFYVDVEVFN